MTVWKEKNGWVFEYFDREKAPSFFGEFQPLVELWQSKRHGRKVPSWSDFDFYDFKGWHGLLSVSEYYYDPFDFKYLIFGTDIARQVEMENTGKLASSLAGTRYDPTKDFDFYEMSARGLYISRGKRDFLWADSPTTSVKYIELPMSDDCIRTDICLTAMMWDKNTSIHY